MRLHSPFILAAGLFLTVGLLVPESHAEIITCNDTGLTYATSCPSTGTSGRCINPNDNENGCCNKGTCSGSVCVTGPLADAECLNDGNDCIKQTCAQNLTTHQATCTPSNEDTSHDCDLDSNVCTLDKCDGAGACAATSNVNTCATEQASNPAEQPICKPWVCDPVSGCAKTAVPNDPVVACDDGKDCTTGDHCISGTCGKGSSGTVLHSGEPCRDDDTSLGNGDSRTWCKPGTCDDTDEACDHTGSINAGQPCDPNNCTNATCATNGGACIINSCNTGVSVTCEACGATLTCVNYGAGQSANFPNACGCLSLF